MPSRGPPSGRSTCASRLAACGRRRRRRRAAPGPAASPTTESLPPGEAGAACRRSRARCRRGRCRRRARRSRPRRRRRARWRSPAPSPRGRARTAAAAAAAAVERAAAGASILQADGLGRVGGRRDRRRGRLWPSASAISRSIMQRARGPVRGGGPAVVDDDARRGPCPESAFSLLGLSTGSASARITSAAASMRISVSHQGVCAGVFSLVLDADEDAGRRELDLARPRRNGAQQPLDDRQGQQARQQPGTEECEGAERHGVPPVRGALCGFQR